MVKRTLLHAQVHEKEYVTPGMIRLTFKGVDLSRFQSTGIGDEFVRLFFPDASGHIELPSIADDGTYSFSPDQLRPHSEVYTIKAFDAHRQALTIDFVVHPGGYASEWAQAAQPGDELVLTAPPYAKFGPPKEATKLAFLCDETGLPALCRLLESLPATARALAIVEVAQGTHRQPLATVATLETFWLEGSGNGIGPSGLPQTARRLLESWKPEYVWMGSEQSAASCVRSFVKHTLGLPSARCAILGYWIEKLAQRKASQTLLEDVES